MDARQAQIILQNALAHATKISIHNSKGEAVSVEDVMKMAKTIAKEVILIGRKDK